jgi:hypothetical protein
MGLQDFVSINLQIFVGISLQSVGKNFPQKYSHIKRVYRLFGLDYKKI